MSNAAADAPWRRSSVHGAHIGASEPTRKQMREQRRQRRRMQLAAALVEADNDMIERRLAFLKMYEPQAMEQLDSLLLMPHHAFASALFQDTRAVHNSRPVYQYHLYTMRELTRGYLGMAMQWEGDDTVESMREAEPTPVPPSEEPPQQIELGDEHFGSPVLGVLEQADSIYAHAKQENERQLEKLEESQASRGALLLARIQQSQARRDVSGASTVPDVSEDSWDASRSREEAKGGDEAANVPAEAADERAAENDAASIATAKPADAVPSDAHQVDAQDTSSGSNGPPSAEIAHFRERVLRRRDNERRPSGQRHSLSVSGWPGDSPSGVHALYELPNEEPGTQSTRTLQERAARMQRQLIDMPQNDALDFALFGDLGPLLQRRRTMQRNAAPAAVQQRRGLRQLLRRHRRSKSTNAQPLVMIDPPSESRSHAMRLDEFSPLPEHETSVHYDASPLANDEELTGVNLSPVQGVLGASGQPPELYKQPTAPSARAPEDGPSGLAITHDSSGADLLDVYEQYAVDGADASSAAREPAWTPPYLCVPPPLSALPTEHTSSRFFVPHGAFYVEYGVVLPSSELDPSDPFGPVQVPYGIGRRVMYPTTALFRNALVRRDEEQEGWGWERYTNATQYFADIDADDDDSDDELPLMDVRIQARNEEQTRRRIHRERVRRRRARLERERLRERARAENKPLTAYGVPEDSPPPGSESSTDDDESDESDSERPWVDNLRPAGRLYGANLLGVAGREHAQRRGQVRFYGQPNLNPARHSAPPGEHAGFYNDTADRMRRVFGEPHLWSEEMARRLAADGIAPVARPHSANDLEVLLEPGISDAIVHPSGADVDLSVALLEEAEDDRAVAAWHDSSSDEETATPTGHQSARFAPAKPRWMGHKDGGGHGSSDNDDLPLADLRALDADSESDDAEPLGARHPQAEVIAEKEALIRSLQEENAQVRMLLQMRQSMDMQLGFGMPWGMPPAHELPEMMDAAPIDPSLFPPGAEALPPLMPWAAMSDPGHALAPPHASDVGHASASVGHVPWSMDATPALAEAAPPTAQAVPPIYEPPGPPERGAAHAAAEPPFPPAASDAPHHLLDTSIAEAEHMPHAPTDFGPAAPPGDHAQHVPHIERPPHGDTADVVHWLAEPAHTQPPGEAGP